MASLEERIASVEEAKRALEEALLIAHERVRQLENRELPQRDASVPPEQDEITDIERYEQIGKSLSSSSEVVDILSTIKKIRDWPSPHPFVVIDGSSGVGKTQAAFSLSPTVPVVYLLLSVVKDGDQEVYLSFKQLTQHLNAAIGHDLVEIREPCVQTDTLESYPRPLRSAGLLLAVCRYLRDQAMPASPGVLARRKTPLVFDAIDIRYFMTQMKEFSNWTIVWDEVPGSVQGQETTKITSFARSLSRLAGLAVVMMGTDSTIANMIVRHTTRGTDKPWAFVLTALPSANYDAIVKHYFGGVDPLASPFPEKTATDLRFMLRNCRPLVAYFTLEYARHATSSFSFQDLLAYIFDALRFRKCGPSPNRQSEFLKGQLALLLPFYTEAHIRKALADPEADKLRRSNLDEFLRLESVIVCRHFAMPGCADTMVFRGEQGLALKGGGPWVAYSYFPSKESLLWLALCTSKGFEVSSSTLPTRKVVKQTIPDLRNDLVYENPASTKVSGELFECVACCAVIRASQESLTGLAVAEFLTRLFRELEINFRISADDIARLCPEIRDLRIPFFLPPCVDLTYLCLPTDSFVESFVRPMDKLQVDGISHSVLLEAKDWQQRLRVNHLGNILARLSKHPGPRICLIFCLGKYGMEDLTFSKLKGCTKDLSPSELETFKHSAVLFVSQKRLSDGSSNFSFQKLFAPPNPTRYVFLLPLNQLDTS
jgi:hypothetical protein